MTDIRNKLVLNHRMVCAGNLSRLIVGLILQDYQANGFHGPTGFPGVKTKLRDSLWCVDIYSASGSAPEIRISALTASELLTRGVHKEISSEVYPELYKDVVSRLSYLEEHYSND